MKFLTRTVLATGLTLASLTSLPVTAQAAGARTDVSDISASQRPTCKYGSRGMRCNPKPKSTKRCFRAPCR